MSISDDETSFRKRISEEQRQQAVRLYLEGKNINRVGAEVGIGPTSVSHVLREAGVDMRKPGGGYGGRESPISEEQRNQAVSLYLEGKTTDRVGAEVGLSAVTVAKIVRDAGVDMRKPGGGTGGTGNRR